MAASTFWGDEKKTALLNSLRRSISARAAEKAAIRKEFRGEEIFLIAQELDDEFYPRLKQFLERDPAPNIYALSALLSRKEQGNSKFFVSAQHEGKIDGTLVIRQGYRRPFVWLVSDSEESAKELSKLLFDFPKASVWVKPQFEKILEQTLDGMTCKIDGKWRYDIMELDRSSVKIDIKHQWRALSASDAYAWAKTEALAEKEEKHSGSVSENVEPSQERVNASERLLATLFCFGIFNQNILIARSAIEVLHSGTAIRRVFTDPAFRNRGYGRSITSVAVSEAMKKGEQEKIVLFVMQENVTAKRIYETMGFRRVATRTEFDLVPSQRA